MLVCQWHLDIVYGKQAEAIAVMKEWGRDKFAHSQFSRARGARLLVGHVGPSASHIVDEYLFDSMADFEEALRGMGDKRFHEHSAKLAPYVVPGSQHWVILRVVE